MEDAILKRDTQKNLNTSTQIYLTWLTWQTVLPSLTEIYFAKYLLHYFVVYLISRKISAFIPWRFSLVDEIVRICYEKW
jgi:hypothetical protein